MPDIYRINTDYMKSLGELGKAIELAQANFSTKFPGRSFTGSYEPNGDIGQDIYHMESIRAGSGSISPAHDDPLGKLPAEELSAPGLEARIEKFQDTHIAMIELLEKVDTPLRFGYWKNKLHGGGDYHARLSIDVKEWVWSSPNEYFQKVLGRLSSENGKTIKGNGFSYDVFSGKAFQRPGVLEIRLELGMRDPSVVDVNQLNALTKDYIEANTPHQLVKTPSE